MTDLNGDSSIENQIHSLDSELYELYNDFISFTYPSYLKKFGLTNLATKAEGAIITDSKGKKFIDCVSGYGLFNLGHNHPKIINDLITQLNTKQLFTKPLISEIQVKLAKLLSEITPGNLNCSFLCNSGSEAIDNAIKLARLQGEKKKIITAENSFHGYTFGGLSATGIVSFKRSFQPVIPEIVHVPFGNSEAFEAAISHDTCAILLEPIQHEAGIKVPTKDYFKNVRKICDEHEIILIIDEIKTGFGKTGSMFACDELNIVPDILVLGKSMGGGLIPIGAMVATKNLWRKFSFSFPMSASSFAGNILACQAALSTINIIHQDKLLDECNKKGGLFLKELKEFVEKFPKLIKNVFGKGLLIGLEFINPTKAFEISKYMISQGVIMLPAYGNQSVLMIEPPLVISIEQIDTVLNSLNYSCNKVSSAKKEG